LFLRRLVEQGNILACCAINVAEVYAGMRPKEEERTSAFLGSLDYFPITFAAASLAGELKRDFAKKGATLSLADCMIAAVAIQYRVALITDNVKDFPMRDLELFRLPS
jgi:predicted nucleic acid-binding protein